VRETLGITNDEIAVLYAPTWRDDAKNHDGSGFFHPRLVDWETLCGALPEQMVFLNRLHQHVTQYERPEVGERIKDVSSYEEMSDLILASDILVSDYSSLIYDYAVSGKPIILHAPDLRHYRDQLRSFYFEYEDWVPGPITSNTGELVEQLREVHEVQSVFRHKYNEFVKKFCTFDTGQASTQTVSRLLNDGVL
jgi:CDP-glycerol glycerophosphotransferase